MNCQECELALAGEEQSPVVDGRVEAHMAQCSACREFEVELRGNSEALQAFAMETLPGLKALPGLKVSPQELPGFAPGRQNVTWWATVAAVLVLGFVSSWAMLRSRSSSPPVLPLKTPSAQMPSAASTEQGVPEKGVAQAILSPAGFDTVLPVRRHVARGRQPAPREPLKMSNEPRILQVKMLTDDPNVVIYWQIEN